MKTSPFGSLVTNIVSAAAKEQETKINISSGHKVKVFYIHDMEDGTRHSTWYIIMVIMVMVIARIISKR